MQLSAPNASIPEEFSSQSAAAGFLFPPTDTNSGEIVILMCMRSGVESPAASHHLEDFTLGSSLVAPVWVRQDTLRLSSGRNLPHLSDRLPARPVLHPE